jgi:hypothetical protein
MQCNADDTDATDALFDDDQGPIHADLDEEEHSEEVTKKSSARRVGLAEASADGDFEMVNSLRR